LVVLGAEVRGRLGAVGVAGAERHRRGVGLGLVAEDLRRVVVAGYFRDAVRRVGATAGSRVGSGLVEGEVGLDAAVFLGWYRRFSLAVVVSDGIRLWNKVLGVEYRVEGRWF